MTWKPKTSPSKPLPPKPAHAAAPWQPPPPATTTKPSPSPLPPPVNAYPTLVAVVLYKGVKRLKGLVLDKGQKREVEVRWRDAARVEPDVFMEPPNNIKDMILGEIGWQNSAQSKIGRFGS